MKKIILFFLAVFPLLAGAQGKDSLWAPLPVRFNEQALRLYADTAAGDLYVSGIGERVNNQPCSIVKWDGSKASLMQSPYFFSTNSVLMHKGKLVVSGNNFTKDYCYGLATYDGQTWRIIDSSMSGTSKDPKAILDGKVVFNGVFDTVAGHAITSTAVWDGDTGWSDLYRVDTCIKRQWWFSSLVKYKNQIYIGGTIYASASIGHIARFDGQNWKDVGGGMHPNGLGDVRCMLIWKDELYVAGEFAERDGSPGNCIAKWDGQRWHRLGSGITQGRYEAAIEDMAVYHDELYVVGYFTTAGGIAADQIAKWDGKRWCSLGTKFEGNPSQIEASKGELYISGGFWSVNGDTGIAKIARWTGGDYVQEYGPIEATAVATSAIQALAALLYPNPAGDRLYVKPGNIRQMVIYDASGRLLETLDAAELKAGVDTRQWAPGLYFVKATTFNGETITSRLKKD